MRPSAKTGDAEKSPANRLVQCTLLVCASKHETTPLSEIMYSSFLIANIDGVSGALFVTVHFTCVSVASPAAPLGSIAKTVGRSKPEATNNSPLANTGRGTTEY